MAVPSACYLIKILFASCSVLCWLWACIFGEWPLIVVDILPAEQHPTMISEFLRPLQLLNMHVNQAVKDWGAPCSKLFCRTHVLFPAADLQKKMRWLQILIAFSVSTIVGCWEAYGRVWQVVFGKFVSLLNKAGLCQLDCWFEFAVSLYCIWIPVSVYHCHYSMVLDVIVLFCWKVSKFSSLYM